MSRVYTSPSGWFYAAMFCYLPSPVQVAFCIFLKSEVEWLFFILILFAENRPCLSIEYMEEISPY